MIGILTKYVLSMEQTFQINIKIVLISQLCVPISR